MNKIPSVVQSGSPGAAPLLKIQGAGPRINVPGYRRPEFGNAVHTVEPQQIERKSEKAGVGHLLAVNNPDYGTSTHTVEPQQIERKSEKAGVGHLLDVTA